MYMYVAAEDECGPLVSIDFETGPLMYIYTCIIHVYTCIYIYNVVYVCTMESLLLTT